MRSVNDTYLREPRRCIISNTFGRARARMYTRTHVYRSRITGLKFRNACPPPLALRVSLSRPVSTIEILESKARNRGNAESPIELDGDSITLRWKMSRYAGLSF